MRTWSVFLLLFMLAGCVPGSDSVEFNDGSDTGVTPEDVSMADGEIPEDMMQPEDMAPPTDMEQPPEDMTQPQDMAQPDMGPDAADMCVRETDDEFCTRLGAECGQRTGVDNCGINRTVTSCGMCSGTDSCENNVCVACISETNDAFCTRLGAECGMLSGTDNCGVNRTVTSCGDCPGVDNVCVNNQCECTPESDMEFCSRLNAECGSVTGTDNCGVARTVNDCGMCPNADDVCTNNQCVCTAESDAEFCTRLNAECGMLSGTDNCGMARVVNNCGACGAGEACDMNTCVEDNCGDNVDNDNDGLIDCPDPDCLNKVCHPSGRTCNAGGQCI